MISFLKKHAATGAVFIWLFFLCALVWHYVPAGYNTVNLIRPFDIGENWIFALRPHFDNNLFPYFPTLLAVIQYHLPAWLQYAAVRALFMLPLLLAFASGIFIHSLRAGIFSGSLAAALSCLLLYYGGLEYDQRAEQVLIAAALIMLAGGAALRLRQPLKSIFMGLLISLAVYIKGVLVICLPVFMLCAALKKNGRPRLKDWWPAAAVFFFSLSVWSLLNLHSGNHLVLLEGRGRSEGMIACGAAGLVSTMEGDWRSLPDVPKSGNYTLWAARSIALHPLRFLGIVGERLNYLSRHSLPPLLLACLGFLFLFGIFRLRKNREAWPLILLSCCFIAVHLFFPIEARYFVPIWFLMCAISGIGLADLFKTGGDCPGPVLAAGQAVFLAVSLPLVLFLSYVLFLTATFPLRLARNDVNRLLAGHQVFPFLYAEAGQAAAGAGDLKASAAYYLKAYQLEKNSWRKAAYLRASFMAGTLDSDGIRSFQEPADYQTPMYTALSYAEEGQAAKAKKFLSCALQLCVINSAGIRDASSEIDLQRVAALRRTAAVGCVWRISGILAELPAARRAALGLKLDSISPGVWEPGALMKDFASQNSGRGGLTAFAAANFHVDYDIPKACYGVLPVMPAPGVYAAAGPASAKVYAAEAVACSSSVPKKDRQKALEACQALVYKVDSGEVPLSKDPGLMRSEALFESYGLLNQLERREEARENLIWAVKLAPAGWARLNTAKQELNRTAGL